MSRLKILLAIHPHTRLFDKYLLDTDLQEQVKNLFEEKQKPSSAGLYVDFANEMLKLGFSKEELKEFYIYLNENDIYYKRKGKKIDDIKGFEYRGFYIIQQPFYSKNGQCSTYFRIFGEIPKYGLLSKAKNDAIIFEDFVFGDYDTKYETQKILDKIILANDLVSKRKPNH